jgi:hypothetical protein
LVNLNYSLQKIDYTLSFFLNAIAFSYHQGKRTVNLIREFWDTCIYIPDPCHMIKLVRNTLGEKGIIFDDNNDPILWDYIKKLHELQDAEGLHLANKVKALHVNFYKQKMKVRLATQVLSRSVADALSHLMNDLKLSDFKDCGPTIRFITLFNNLFDIFNSKGQVQNGFNKSLQDNNYEDIFSYLDSCTKYIIKLKKN